jgi:hypothetical protein
MDEPLSGSLAILFLYDVCEEIHLDRLREIFKLPKAGREPVFRQPAPEYVQFQKPPVIERVTDFPLEGGEPLSGRLAWYDYGVASLRLQVPFGGSWEDLVALAARWINSPELEHRAGEFVRSAAARASPAMEKPYSEWLSEDYYITQLWPVSESPGRTLTALELIEKHGDSIAQIVRGELAQFSAQERAEILGPHLSYYETDLVVAGWNAAFVYDTSDGAAPTVQILEYANTQLLEFRHYDGVLTELLSQVYPKLERGTGVLARWGMAREAERLNAIRLDVRELAERVDNSIKFLSDMFAARLYRMAAARIGVPDYRTLVEKKMDSTGDLYRFMMDRFYQGGNFWLELMIVVILVIELGYLFRGK